MYISIYNVLLVKQPSALYRMNPIDVCVFMHLYMHTDSCSLPSRLTLRTALPLSRARGNSSRASPRHTNTRAH